MQIPGHNGVHEHIFSETITTLFLSGKIFFGYTENENQQLLKISTAEIKMEFSYFAEMPVIRMSAHKNHKRKLWREEIWGCSG